MNKRTVLVWFRNDLRIQDNEMLSRACERGETIVPVYCFDPRYYTQTKFNTHKTGKVRATFINESVQYLQDYFKSLNGTLIIKYGLPEEIIPQLAQQYQVNEVYHHREVAHEETTISSLVEDALWRLKINLRHFIGHTLFHKEDFPFAVRDIPDSFPVFRKKLERESFIRACFANPENVSFLKGMEETTVPSLEELGFDPILSLQNSAEVLMHGGEDEGRKQLARILKGGAEQSEATLSPWLALGCLSVHSVYFAVMESALPKKQKESIFQGLWWKDYYRFMFKKYQNTFFKEQGFSSSAVIPILSNEEGLNSWKNGETGHSAVDTIMRNLNSTGYISNPCRQLAATYLIYELEINWTLGAAYFEEKLIDYAPASNWGNWANIAGVGNDKRLTDTFSFEKQLKIFDPKGAYLQVLGA